ncbi:TPA: helix-turn-helix transcriptional regulator [Listeria monocytogenes]|uniref:helix-turn-helix domain-containing protein n=1 Tax=Listeria monocytogenes TaxID=1639 RepID=UPI001650062C|nr:helix-turn-helix transcriptional regulator [Listeria monocytogenes]HAO6187754.1 helix-turn-helix transcriptional regulator [Listeria monocytogenes]HCY9071799.1 helix-turn-helix transcriptional regulator [Listeria monocytogenes]
MEIGEKIRTFREKKGISQTKLSDISGVPQSTISTIEIKSKAPDIYILKKLADALDINLSDLLEDNNLTKAGG